MAIPPREQAIAEYFYRRISRLVDNDELLMNEKAGALRRCILELFERVTEQDKLHFSTNYARITYAAHKHGIDRSLTVQERMFRRRRTGNLSPEALIDHLSIGYRIALELVNALLGVAVPPKLLPLLEAPYSKYDRPATKRIWYQLRVLVVSVDHDSKTMGVRIERKPETLYTIPYGEEELADGHVPAAVAIVRKISGPFVTLNLLKVELRGEDRLYPAQIVIEPDFLVNVTDVANCFSNGPAFQAWTSLPKRLLPFEKRPPLVRGNIVNSFLDVLIHTPDTSFSKVLPGIFEMQPLELCLFTDQEVRQLVADLKHHFLTVSKFVNQLLPELDINRQTVMLEPTFLSPAYGLQGRLDLLQSQHDIEEGLTSIVELKTSKIYQPNIHGIRSDNFIQTLLYDLMINFALGRGANVRSYILYSVDYDKPVRYAPPEFSRQLEAIAARNQLVGLEFLIARLGGEEVREQTDKLFAKIHPARFKRLGKFSERDHLAVLTTYEELSDTERRYFGAFMGFIAREQRLAKIGEQRTDHLNGLASLWLDERHDKIDRFELLDGLTFDRYDTQENILVLSRDTDEEVLSKFRQGDIVALYGTPAKQTAVGDAVRAQLFKSTVIAIQPASLHLRPRNIQLNDGVFRRSPYWSIEKDVLESSFKNHYLGLYLWASAPSPFRRRWLGAMPPDRADAHPNRISIDLTDEQDRILRKVITAPDYFLLWGPPGTGKTSKMLHHLVRHLLEHTTETVLLVAYTNRAVDEICESIERISTAEGSPFREYLRIGSRLGASERYQDRLLQLRSQGVTKRKELRALIDGTRIVVGTVASVGGNNELFKLKSFDRIVIDEASQILEPLLAAILTRAPRNLLIGDHRQLPAVVQQPDRDTKIVDPALLNIGVKDLSTSLFERLYLTAKREKWTWAYDQLRHQGRMHRDIMAFPAIHFYEKELDILPVGFSHHLQQIAPLSIFGGGDELTRQLAGQRLVFINTEVDHSTPDPKVNLHEARMLLRLVDSFTRLYASTDHPLQAGDIGIITPYRAQIALVRRELSGAGLDPDDYTVDTVERYQGSAKRIILMSLCANETAQLERMSKLSDEGVDRKLNVAMTRAREHLVLVGCRRILQQHLIYGRLLEHVATELTLH